MRNSKPICRRYKERPLFLKERSLKRRFFVKKFFAEKLYVRLISNEIIFVRFLRTGSYVFNKLFGESASLACSRFYQFYAVAHVGVYALAV